MGLEAKEFKILLVANQDQIYPKPFQHLVQQYEGLESGPRGSGQYTDGTFPAYLYQAGSYGPCLSALRSKMICSVEGNFMGKGRQDGSERSTCYAFALRRLATKSNAKFT